MPLLKTTVQSASHSTGTDISVRSILLNSCPFCTYVGSSGDTNSLKFRYKQELKLYKEYQEYKRNTIKLIQGCFDEDVLVNLESDGILVGITPMKIYEHMWNNFLLPMDKDREILKAKELLKVE